MNNGVAKGGEGGVYLGMRFRIVTPDNMHTVDAESRQEVLNALVEAGMEWHYFGKKIVVWEMGTMLLNDEVRGVIERLSKRGENEDRGSSLSKKAKEVPPERVEKNFARFAEEGANEEAPVVEKVAVAHHRSKGSDAQHEVIVGTTLKLIAKLDRPVQTHEIWNKLEETPSDITRSRMTSCLGTEAGKVAGSRLVRVHHSQYDRVDDPTAVRAAERMKKEQEEYLAGLQEDAVEANEEYEAEKHKNRVAGRKKQAATMRRLALKAPPGQNPIKVVEDTRSPEEIERALEEARAKKVWSE